MVDSTPPPHFISQVTPVVILTVVVEELGKKILSQVPFSPLQISHSVAGHGKISARTAQ
jgi:hypothetical protein